MELFSKPSYPSKMKKKSSAPSPKLKLCAAEWTLRDHPSAAKEWSIDRKVKAAKEAGFVGLSAGAAPDIVQACSKYGIQLIGMIDISSVGEVESKLDRFKGSSATHVNVQLCDHDTAIPKAVTIARKAILYGESIGLKPAIEWHRDTCTETPEKGLALIDQYKRRYGDTLRVNFDYSHPAIIKHLHPGNFWSRLAEYRIDLLKSSELIHFRTFTGSHCQTPITNGRGKLDLDFIAWRDHFLKPALAAWLESAKPGQTLWAVVELGPKGSGYALDCFPNVWKDAIVARQEIEKVWRSLMRKR